MRTNFHENLLTNRQFKFDFGKTYDILYFNMIYLKPPKMLTNNLFKKFPEPWVKSIFVSVFQIPSYSTIIWIFRY